MGRWWRRHDDGDPRPEREVSVDEEFDRTKQKIDGLLDELKQAVDRFQYFTEAERERQRRAQPGTT